MPSSTSSSDPATPARTSPRRYALALLGLILAGLLAGEWFVRSQVSRAVTLSPAQTFVLKILTTDSSDIVTGDSHVGTRDYYRRYAFLGQGGITPRELERALRTYFRARPVGRVMVEVGMQQLSVKRQAEWRALARNSLIRQFLPFPVYVLEPELISIAEQRMSGLLERSARTEPTDGTARAKRKAGKARKSYAALPKETRMRRLPIHAERQRPVADFEHSVAWQAQVRMIRRLIAKGGKVCLVRTPLTHEYEDWLESVGEEWGYMHHRRAVIALAQELHVPYIDYLDLRFGDLPLDNFLNPDHLNAKGHRAFWRAADRACFPAAESVNKKPGGKPADRG